MLAFLADNLSTVIGALLVAALFAGVCRKMWKDHRAGKHSCSCGGGCSGCPNSVYCCSPKPDRSRLLYHPSGQGAADHADSQPHP